MNWADVPFVSILWNYLRSADVNSLKSVLNPFGPGDFFSWNTFNDCFYLTRDYRSF